MKAFSKKIKIITKLIFIFALAVNLSCSKDDDEIDKGQGTDFNAQVAQLQFFDQPDELKSPEELSESNPERDIEDTSLECYVKTFKAAPGYDEMLSLDPSTDVIFPGALLKGESIPTGEYIPITANRAPITLSASLTNINGSPVVEIVDPKLSTVREGIKTVLDQEVTGATAARVNFEVTQVYSEEHLGIALGVNYRAAGQSVSSSFNFDQSTYKNKFVLKYLQTYYTIDMDPPSNPSDLFRVLPDLNSLGSTSPVYVASVAYGRMVLYTIETNASQTDIEAAFDASFKYNETEIDAEYSKIINESSIKALIIGGSGGDAAEAINGPADVYEYIANGGNYSKDSPGAPLAYKLRYIKKGTPVARVVLTSEYPIRTCDLAYPRFRISINSLRVAATPGSEGSHLEIYGNVTGKINKGSNKEAKWSRSKANNLRFTGLHFINEGVEIELYRPNYDEDYIELSGSLRDKDPISDDFLGNRSKKVLLRSLEPEAASTGVQLIFDEKPQHDVRANFSVQRVK